MGRSVAAVAVGIPGIVVPPGRVSGNGLFEQCAEVFQQGILPFVHEEGRGGMERLYEDESRANTGFANEVFHAPGQVDQFESLPGGEINHVCRNYWRQSECCRLARIFGRWGFKLRLHVDMLHLLTSYCQVLCCVESSSCAGWTGGLQDWYVRCRTSGGPKENVLLCRSDMLADFVSPGRSEFATRGQ